MTMSSSRNLLRVISWLWETNKAYCTIFLKSLSIQQVQYLLLTDPIATKRICELAGVQLPALPPLLKHIMAPGSPDVEPISFDFKDNICQPQCVIEDTNSSTLGTTNLFTSGDFDQRSRKPHFLTTEVVSIEQWQANIDLLINRVLDKLDSGPYNTIELEVPIITKVNQENQTGSGSNTTNWPISYPNVGKWHRKSTWNKLYTAARDNFRSQWLGSSTVSSSYIIKVAETISENPLLQLLDTITLLRKESKTRMKYCLSQVELLASILNTISIHRWTISKQSFSQLLHHCLPHSHEVFPLLCPQALLIVGANKLSLDKPRASFHVAQLLAQAYNKNHEHAEKAKCPESDVKNASTDEKGVNRSYKTG